MYVLYIPITMTYREVTSVEDRFTLYIYMQGMALMLDFLPEYGVHGVKREYPLVGWRKRGAELLLKVPYLCWFCGLNPNT